MTKKDDSKVLKIVYYLIIGLLFTFVFQKPFEIIFLNLLVDSIKHLKTNEGKTDFDLFQNHPASKEKRYILSIYKSDQKNRVEIQRSFADKFCLFSNDSNLDIHTNAKQGVLLGTGKIANDGIFCIVSDTASLTEINKLKQGDGKKLLILTQHQYHKENLKNVFGVSLAVGFTVFMLVASYFANKIIDETPKKKKIILFSQ